MNHFSKLFGRGAALLAALLIPLALLSACGGSSSSDSSAKIRLINASMAYSSGLDLVVSDTKLASSISYGNASSYADASASSITTLVQSGGSTITSLSPTLSADKHYSLIAYGWAGNMKSTILQEEEDAPDASYAKLLVLNLAADAGTLDVYLTQNVDDLSSATATVSAVAGNSSSGYKTVSSGTYRARVTGYAKYSDLRLDIPSITLSSKQVATLVITPTQGGVLVNSLLITQQSSVSSYSTSNARARVVAAVADYGQVSATLGGSTLMTTSIAPNIGEYQTVASGASSLAVTVAGAAQPTATPTLTAGNDYTVLVWGEPASPQITLLSDDNRLPSSGYAKFRLINAVARLNAGLTMTLDYSAIATNIQPGASSTPSTVGSSSSSLLQVTSPTSGTPVYSISELPVLSSGVYTVFMMGGANSIAGTLRRER
jgi:hypothetical protein